MGLNETGVKYDGDIYMQLQSWSSALHNSRKPHKDRDQPRYYGETSNFTNLQQNF